MGKIWGSARPKRVGFQPLDKDFKNATSTLVATQFLGYSMMVQEKRPCGKAANGQGE